MSFDPVIKLIIILLLIFTPLAFGSMEIWAFSLLELGILLIIVLYILRESFLSRNSAIDDSATFRIPRSALVLCSFFLAFILFQMIPLPAAWVKVISPQTYYLRTQLLSDLMPAAFSPLPVSNSLLPIAHRLFPISFFPFATKIEFFKWATLIGLFFFLLRWKLLSHRKRATQHLILVIMLVGIIESFYGIFEFFSGHRHILYLEGTDLMSSVMGTFINRNYFAGYLLMVIPLSVGFLLAREKEE